MQTVRVVPEPDSRQSLPSRDRLGDLADSGFRYDVGEPGPPGDPKAELAMLVQVRAFLQKAEGPDFRPTTRLVDEALDRMNDDPGTAE